MDPLISWFDAVILGTVEGLTEFLPVSSTGHLILVSEWLNLYRNPATKAGVDAFEIVIQSGALLAVIGIYITHIRAMLRGLRGQDSEGRRLLRLLLVGFLPAAIIGVLAGSWIKSTLFGIGPVIAALAIGGLLMVVIERRFRRQLLRKPSQEELPLAAMTLRSALVIGLAQCLAMWPGTSRSMVTIMTARLLGYQPRAAAEFSFLLALPTLGGATTYELFHQGPVLLQTSSAANLTIGLGVSCLVAWLAVKGFLVYLNRHGMELFGWYRIALAFGMVFYLS
ncbi:MAG: undecaprenyl-diphosphate phosphatase [Desulfuromonadales bacterium]|nr:undecaprenyl-diphosphate phosphatase [Desulfuromonadales bacterium]